LFWQFKVENCSENFNFLIISILIFSTMHGLQWNNTYHRDKKLRKKLINFDFTLVIYQL